MPFTRHIGSGVVVPFYKETTFTVRRPEPQFRLLDVYTPQQQSDRRLITGFEVLTNQQLGRIDCILSVSHRDIQQCLVTSSLPSTREVCGSDDDVGGYSAEPGAAETLHRVGFLPGYALAKVLVQRASDAAGGGESGATRIVWLSFHWRDVFGVRDPVVQEIGHKTGALYEDTFVPQGYMSSDPSELDKESNIFINQLEWAVRKNGVIRQLFRPSESVLGGVVGVSACHFTDLTDVRASYIAMTQEESTTARWQRWYCSKPPIRQEEPGTTKIDPDYDLGYLLTMSSTGESICSGVDRESIDFGDTQDGSDEALRVYANTLWNRDAAGREHVLRLPHLARQVPAASRIASTPSDSSTSGETASTELSPPEASDKKSWVTQLKDQRFVLIGLGLLLLGVLVGYIAFRYFLASSSMKTKFKSFDLRNDAFNDETMMEEPSYLQSRLLRNNFANRSTALVRRRNTQDLPKDLSAFAVQRRPTLSSFNKVENL